MDSFVFNSFKERFINGEVPEYDTWTLWPVNKAFTADYEPVIDRFRTLNDFISYNKQSVPESWFVNYSTNLQGMTYYYTKMSDADNAEEPEYITQESWNQFIKNNEGNEHLGYMFFNPESQWFRPYDIKWEKVLDEYGQLIEVSSYIPRGFYFVRTKEELKWCAEKVNGNTYDNAINIVLGDNIGIMTQSADDNLTNIDFSVGSNPAQPYEGIFYGNGYKFTNINLKCKNDVNGIIGYLGTSGIISTVDIVKNNRVECHKQINIQHLIDNGTDVAAGFLCGKNNGRIEYVRVLDKMTFSNFVPKIYNIHNKTDKTSENNAENEAYHFYPDYMCYNSMGNIIPYVGYFNEGVFATYSGYSKPDNTYYTYWNTTFYNQNPEVTKLYQGGTRGVNYGNTNIISPMEWYYWVPITDGYTRTNADGTAEHAFIMHATPEHNRKNVLWYDSNIIMKTKQTTVPDTSGFSVVSDGLVYLNEAYSGIPNALSSDAMFTSNIEYAHYFDKSLKLSQQNRVAYYVSPIVGINNGKIEHVREECDMNMSGSFVGFMGGLAGKQNYGIIYDTIVNVSSTDRVWEPSDNLKMSYNIRNFEHIPATETDFLFFTKKSIKNIGGLFGSLVVTDQLYIENTWAYLYNDNKVNINKTDASDVYDDYSFMNRYGTLAAITEYNTSNISDIWTNTESLNNPQNRTITIKNSVFSYNEGFDTVNTTASDTYDLYSPYLSLYGGEVPLAVDYMFGVVSPLIAEIKPTYLSTPSILSTPFFNAENIRLTPPTQVTGSEILTSATSVIRYIGFGSEYMSLKSTLQVDSWSFNEFIKYDTARLGLYTTDLYLGATFSNYGNIYSINTEVDLPGIANRHTNDSLMYGIAGGQIDRLNCTAAENFDIDIKNIASRLINFENCYITNNYGMAENPISTVTVPAAAYIYPAYGITGNNPETDTIVITGKGVPESTSAIVGGYNANKVIMTYPYFGSDLILNRNTGFNSTDVITNWGIYRIEYENPYYMEYIDDIIHEQAISNGTFLQSVADTRIHCNDYVKNVTITMNEQILKGRPFTPDDPVTGYEHLYRVSMKLDFGGCPVDENPYGAGVTTLEYDCSPDAVSDGYHGFTNNIVETIQSTVLYEDDDEYYPIPSTRFVNKSELYAFLDKYCNGARKGSWVISHKYTTTGAIERMDAEIRTFTFIPFCDEYWPYDGTPKAGYFPPYNRFGIMRIAIMINKYPNQELRNVICKFCKNLSFRFGHLKETAEYPMKIDPNTGLPVNLEPGDDEYFVMPKHFYEMSLIGKVKNGLLQSNNVTVNGLNKMDANWNPFNDASIPSIFDMYTQTYYGYGDFLAKNGADAVSVSGTKQKYSEYFKYTYTKIMNGAIIPGSLKYDVQFDSSKQYAGYWFYNHDNVSPTNEYNDDFSYTPNILNIGKTVNENCIINKHLISGDEPFAVSSFSADDFEGLLVTDSNYLPVMYIDVGLGECSDGTTWSYDCKKHNGPSTGSSGLLLEMNYNE